MPGRWPSERESLNDSEPPPRTSEYPACWDILLQRPEFEEIAERVRTLLEKDIRERDAMGTEKYGVRLRPFDGRNTLHDIYQEHLDALVYSVKYFYEMAEQLGTGSIEASNAYHLVRRALDLAVDTRRLILRVEGR